MVIREHGGGCLCIPQTQHAALAGQMARAWGNETFPVPMPEAEVCMAAERHDDGMEDFDEAPELDPDTGRPRSFMKMPLDRWLECWRQGPAIVAADSPYAGILVSKHGEGLLGYRDLSAEDDEGREAANAWLAEQVELREEWALEAETDPALEPCLGAEAIERNRNLIATWDAMSLAVCMPRLPARFERVPGERDELTVQMRDAAGDGSGALVVEVDPWPFSGHSVPLAAAGRPLDRTYSEPAQMREALAAAEPTVLSLTLLPPQERGGERPRGPDPDMPKA